MATIFRSAKQIRLDVIPLRERFEIPLPGPPHYGKAAIESHWDCIKPSTGQRSDSISFSGGREVGREVGEEFGGSASLRSIWNLSEFRREHR